MPARSAAAIWFRISARRGEMITVGPAPRLLRRAVEMKYTADFPQPVRWTTSALRPATRASIACHWSSRSRASDPARSRRISSASERRGGGTSVDCAMPRRYAVTVTGGAEPAPGVRPGSTGDPNGARDSGSVPPVAHIHRLPSAPAKYSRASRPDATISAQRGTRWFCRTMRFGRSAEMLHDGTYRLEPRAQRGGPTAPRHPIAAIRMDGRDLALAWTRSRLDAEDVGTGRARRVAFPTSDVTRVDIRSAPFSIWQDATAESGSEVECRREPLSRVGVDRTIDNGRHRLRDMRRHVAEPASRVSSHDLESGDGVDRATKVVRCRRREHPVGRRA